MSRQVRVSEETYARLQKIADGRPLGMIIDRALDAYNPPANPGDHQFTPQPRNALKCANCGRRKAEH